MQEGPSTREKNLNCICHSEKKKLSKNTDIYFGCENITNFRNEKQIISWENPFGQYFDTSAAWGPTKGRELYLGLRLKLK